jgi:hypothetical protein
MRHYTVRKSGITSTREERDWAVCCEGHELTLVPERQRAIALASKVAQADSEEFGHETDVLIEGESGGLMQYAIFGAMPRMC